MKQSANSAQGLLTFIRGLLLVYLVGGTLGALWVAGSIANEVFINKELVMEVKTWMHDEEYGSKLDRAYDVVESGVRPYSFVSDQTGQLIYREPSTAKRLLLHLTATDLRLDALVFYLIVSFLLYRVLQDLKLDSPFTMRNAQRIRWIGLVIIAGDVWRALTSVLTKQLIPDYLAGKAYLGSSSTLGVNFEIGFGGWVTGIIIVIIAAVYQQGIVLAQDAELTV